LHARKFNPLFLFGLIGLFVLLRCIPYEYDSRWPDRVITVDGSDADWENAKVYVDKVNISFGVLNDSEFLYVCMASLDRRIARQIMGRGLIMWIDSKGGQDKTFGIHFPLGFRGRDEEPGGMDREASTMEFDPSGMMPRAGLTDLEILGPGKKDVARMPIQEAIGIQAKASMDSGRIVYELKVPLGRSSKTPYAIGTGLGKNIAIGLETPEFKDGRNGGRSAGRGGPPGGEIPQEGESPEGELGAGGGRGPGMGGPGMGGRGMGRGVAGGFSQPEQLKFWVLVHLASQGTSVEH
jgi:hypothetical protein